MHAALLAQREGRAWLVATGALTNVALLFTTYPELASHIKGLSIMGGAIGDSYSEAPMGHVKGEGERFGNTTRWAEFNIYVRTCSYNQRSKFYEADCPSVTLKQLDPSFRTLFSLQRRH